MSETTISTTTFFDQPILNSPYDVPDRHWEIVDKQATNRVLTSRRRADQYFSPVPEPKKRRISRDQGRLNLSDAFGLSSAEQEYNPTPIINEVRAYVETWRNLPNPDQWLVTPTTARLLKHWRRIEWSGIRPFFCQVEAVETVIWLVEVAPKQAPGRQSSGHTCVGPTIRPTPNFFVSP